MTTIVDNTSKGNSSLLHRFLQSILQSFSGQTEQTFPLLTYGIFFWSIQDWSPKMLGPEIRLDCSQRQRLRFLRGPYYLRLLDPVCEESLVGQHLSRIDVVLLTENSVRRIFRETKPGT